MTVRRARLAAGLACVLVFVALALQLLGERPVARLDAEAIAWLAMHRSAGLTRAMLLVSEVHETVKLLGVAGLLAAWLLLRRDGVQAGRLLVLPAAMLLNVGMKNAFLRPRPRLEEPLVQIATYSFPSGHAVASTVFYGLLCGLVFAHWRAAPARIAAVIVAVTMVLLVCFSRVYLGAHYPGDVIAGAAMGLLWLVAFPPPRPAGSGVDSRP